MKIVQCQMAPIADHVPTELANLVTWILQKDPKDRPKIRDVLNDVRVSSLCKLLALVLFDSSLLGSYQYLSLTHCIISICFFSDL
jgi:hypothetical protein